MSSPLTAGNPHPRGQEQGVGGERGRWRGGDLLHTHHLHTTYTSPTHTHHTHHTTPHTHDTHHTHHTCTTHTLHIHTPHTHTHPTPHNTTYTHTTHTILYHTTYTLQCTHMAPHTYYITHTIPRTLHTHYTYNTQTTPHIHTSFPKCKRPYNRASLEVGEKSQLWVKLKVLITWTWLLELWLHRTWTRFRRNMTSIYKRLLSEAYSSVSFQRTHLCNNPQDWDTKAPATQWLPFSHFSPVSITRETLQHSSNNTDSFNHVDETWDFDLARAWGL